MVRLFIIISSSRGSRRANKKPRSMTLQLDLSYKVIDKLSSSNIRCRDICTLNCLKVRVILNLFSMLLSRFEAHKANNQ
jgi:hypothetical protein